MTNPDHLARSAAEDFASATRPELEAFAEMLDVSYHPNIGDEKLKERLLAKLGKGVPDGDRTLPHEFITPNADGESGMNDAQKHDVETTAVDDVTGLIQLNLTPDSTWQGRRRLVQITRPEGMKGVYPQPFRWGRNLCMVPFNKTVSVPYPIYHLIKNSNFKEVRQVRSTGDDGTPRIINKFTVHNRWNLTDIGDDPATINLPVSQKDQFRRVAEACGMFEEWPRRKLVALARRLRVRFRRDDSQEDIRLSILEKIGFDIEMELVA